MKFRVWDKEQYKYLDKHNVHHLENNDGVFSIVLNMDIQKISGKDRFKIEWSTGLLDDNGKEIYVGDIVKIFKDNIDTTLVNVCYYCDDIGAYSICSWKISEKILNEIYTFKVIGNINQNPELL